VDLTPKDRLRAAVVISAFAAVAFIARDYIHRNDPEPRPIVVSGGNCKSDVMEDSFTEILFYLDRNNVSEARATAARASDWAYEQCNADYPDPFLGREP
jgi:hypothetical protein